MFKQFSYILNIVCDTPMRHLLTETSFRCQYLTILQTGAHNGHWYLIMLTLDTDNVFSIYLLKVECFDTA